jgi:hypothetical protein
MIRIKLCYGVANYKDEKKEKKERKEKGRKEDVVKLNFFFLHNPKSKPVGFVCVNGWGSLIIIIHLLFLFFLVNYRL